VARGFFTDRWARRSGSRVERTGPLMPPLPTAEERAAQKAQAKEEASRAAQVAAKVAAESREDRLRRLADRWNAVRRDRRLDDVPRIMSTTTWLRHRDNFTRLAASWPGEPVLLWAEPIEASPGAWTRIAVLGLPQHRTGLTSAAGGGRVAFGMQVVLPDRSKFGAPWPMGEVGFAGAMPHEPLGELVNLSHTDRIWSSSPISAPAGSDAGDAIWTLDLLMDIIEGRDRFGALQARLESRNIVVGTVPMEPLTQKQQKRRGRGPKPQLRLVRDAGEAEEMAAEWVRWLGWSKARRTQATGDGGIDVLCKNAKGTSKVAAQVKFEALPTGRPVLQAL
jgi:hypothetical protein